MFIRWKRQMTRSKKSYKLYNEVKTDEVYYTNPETGAVLYRYKKVPKTEDEKTNRLSAYLCTSVRIDGKPRQKAVYLASISNKYKDAVGHRCSFWRQVSTRLDALSVSPELRALAEAAILQRIPRPSEEEVAKNEAEFAAFMQSLRNLRR